MPKLALGLTSRGGKALLVPFEGIGEVDRIVRGELTTGKTAMELQHICGDPAVRATIFYSGPTPC